MRMEHQYIEVSSLLNYREVRVLYRIQKRSDRIRDYNGIYSIIEFTKLVNLILMAIQFEI